MVLNLTVLLEWLVLLEPKLLQLLLRRQGVVVSIG
jgi:hypothetical protein